MKSPQNVKQNQAKKAIMNNKVNSLTINRLNQSCSPGRMFAFMFTQQSSPLTKTFQPSSEKACPEIGKSGDFVQCVPVQHSSMIASAASPTCCIP